jgi:hypothetical protein
MRPMIWLRDVHSIGHLNECFLVLRTYISRVRRNAPESVYHAEMGLDYLSTPKVSNSWRNPEVC